MNNLINGQVKNIMSPASLDLVTLRQKKLYREIAVL